METLLFIYLLIHLANTAPYNVRFLSDAFETNDEASVGIQSGFKLTYTQVTNCGTPATVYYVPGG